MQPGEARLETFWADRVIADPGRLKDFPYLDSYRLLADGEHHALSLALGRTPTSVAFVGSGPFPLTAIELHRLDPQLRITCLDRDPVALARGARAAAVLCSDPSRLRFLHADADDFDYSGHDAVVTAALVGLTRATKRSLLGSVARTLRPDAVLAARSVPSDGRQWLYLRIEPADVPDRLTLIGEWEPPPGVLNSLLLLRTRPTDQTRDHGSGRPCHPGRDRTTHRRCRARTSTGTHCRGPRRSRVL